MLKRVMALMISSALPLVKSSPNIFFKSIQGANEDLNPPSKPLISTASSLSMPSLIKNFENLLRVTFFVVRNSSFHNFSFCSSVKYVPALPIFTLFNSLNNIYSVYNKEFLGNTSFPSK